MAVYQKALKLLYVDQLLERMKAQFVLQYEPKVRLLPHPQSVPWPASALQVAWMWQRVQDGMTGRIMLLCSRQWHCYGLQC